MVEGIQPQGVCPRCNNVGHEWYGRKLTDPPLVDPKVEKSFGQSGEEDATLEATHPMRDNWPPN